jgi:CRP-like cAMP-binding protein
LLRDSPRTATVRATRPTRLLTLDRNHFIAAVTGNPSSLGAADRVIEARLTGAGAPTS